MLLKNCQNIEKIVPFSAVAQFVGPIFKVICEHSYAFKNTKINRGFKQVQ